MYSNKGVKHWIPCESNVRTMATFFSSPALFCSVYQSKGLFLSKAHFIIKYVHISSLREWRQMSKIQKADTFNRWTAYWICCFYPFFEPVRWCQQRSCSWPGLRRAGSWFGWRWWWHGTPPPPPAADRRNQTPRLPWSWLFPIRVYSNKVNRDKLCTTTYKTVHQNDKWKHIILKKNLNLFCYYKSKFMRRTCKTHKLTDPVGWKESFTHFSQENGISWLILQLW